LKKVRAHIYVSGRVQGVFFRVNTKRVAQGLRLTGTVQNLSDGSVEVYASGEKNVLKRLLQYLKTGPEHAVVEDVVVNFEKEQRFNGFRII